MMLTSLIDFIKTHFADKALHNWIGIILGFLEVSPPLCTFFKKNFQLCFIKRQFFNKVIYEQSYIRMKKMSVCLNKLWYSPDGIYNIMCFKAILKDKTFKVVWRKKLRQVAILGILFHGANCTRANFQTQPILNMFITYKQYLLFALL